MDNIMYTSLQVGQRLHKQLCSIISTVENFQHGNQLHSIIQGT